MLRPPDLPDSWHMKMVRMSALGTGPLLPAEDTLSTDFCYSLIQQWGKYVNGHPKLRIHTSEMILDSYEYLPVGYRNDFR